MVALPFSLAYTGSVCLLAEEDRLLFTGDNGNPVLFLFLPNCATLETWLRSAKRMLALARETGAAMYSGHGFSELAEETVQAQIRHMEAVLPVPLVPQNR